MKHFIFLSLVFACSISAMHQMNQPWSKENVDRLRHRLRQTIAFGSRFFYDTNGLLRVYKEIELSLQKQEPHQLGDHVILAQLLFDQCRKKKNYKHAFHTALFLQRQSPAAHSKDSGWNTFHLVASHLIADRMEAGSSLRMNRSAVQLSSLFENNSTITIDSKEGKYLFAGTLVLYFLKELQDRKVKKLSNTKN